MDTEVRLQNQRRWVGGLGSIVAQGVVFFLLDHFLGNFVSAVAILAINLALAASHGNVNPYMQGARWATFLNLSWAAYARHEYWYQDVFESFMRLRDFNNPVEWNQVFCRGTLEEVLLVGVTSAMLISFYYLVAQWPEWTDRWELVRRGFFSASLGLQTVIFVTLLYPTVTTMATSLFFASVVSPILRRQVRINHIVFMMLVVLFSLGCPPVAIFYAFITGYFFLYFVASERSLSPRNAAFSFFSGMVTLALFLSLVEAQVNIMGSDFWGTFASVVTCSLVVALGYWLALDDKAATRLREVQMRLTPAFLVTHPWWAIRSLWVDREVAHRTQGLYGRKTMERRLSFFMFGPRAWRDNGVEPERASHAKINVVPTILTLPFFALFLWINASIGLAVGNRLLTVGTLAAGFVVIIGIPTAILWRHITKRTSYTSVSIILTAFTWAILAFFMGIIVYFGLTASQGLQDAADNTDPSTTQTNTITKPAECSCTRHDSGTSPQDRQQG